MGYKRKTPLKVGHPPKYKPEYCQMLIDHMSNGYSFATFAAIVKCHVDTLYNWVNLFPAFSEALAIAQANRALTLEKTAVNISKGAKGSAPMTQFLLKNLGTNFEYHDKIEQKVESTVQQDINLIPKFGDE